MKGIRQTGSGWQVFTKKGGRFRSKHFPPDTDLRTLKREQATLDALATLNREAAPDLTGETLADDIARYLQAVAGMTTYKDRAYRIRQWRDVLGPGMSRLDIAPLDIRRTLERWRKDGLSNGSLNLRRTALMHFFTVTDPEAINPVKRVPRYREETHALRLPTLPDAQKAIKAMKQYGKSPHRLLVLLWTGWPPAQLMRMTAADVDLKRGTARVPARQKGAGAKAVTLPLLPQAVAALKAFHKADAWGEFSTNSLRKRLIEACTRAKVKPFRIYDLRHLFLTTIATITKDDRLVAELAQHSDLRQTRRYTEQSVDPRLLAGLKRVTATIGKR